MTSQDKEQVTTNTDEAFSAVRSYALSLPETTEEFPWGESAVKVKGKTIVYLWKNEDRLTFSLKLISSHYFALQHPFVNKMGQTLKQGGWVQCRFKEGDDIPIDLLREWVHQSYCAVAPKKILQAASLISPTKD